MARIIQNYTIIMAEAITRSTKVTNGDIAELIHFSRIFNETTPFYEQGRRL